MIVTVTLTACGTGPTPAPIDAYRVLPGKWGWQESNDCLEAPEEIRFSDAGKRMHLSHSPVTQTGTREPRRETSYTILESTFDRLSMAMDGESRLDASGRPVTWDLVLLSSDEYCWHRSDWRATACTKSLNRCARD